MYVKIVGVYVESLGCERSIGKYVGCTKINFD